MNKRIIFTLTIASFFVFSPIFGQNVTDSVAAKESNWKLESIFSLNITQSTFTNWASGGRNNISGLAFINAGADYTKDRIKWANSLSTGIGGIQYFKEHLEKTDDVIDIQSTFSYGLKDPWYFSVLGGFKTQYLNGYSNPTDSLYSSTFMSPGYVNLSVGIEYIPNDNFKILLSPLSGKFTFVRDTMLSNQGAYGVTPGKHFRPEYGAYFRLVYKKMLMENINFRSRLEFFTNYMENPENVDVNAEIIVDFKVNKWFSANLQLNLIYDDDIAIKDRHGNVGPRTQFKQVIGLGIAYRLANFKK